MAATGTSKRRQGASRHEHSAHSGADHALRWFGSGVLCGVLLSVTGYLVLMPSPAPGERNTGAAPAGSGSDASIADKTLQPEIDFFDVLPRQRIEVEVDEAQMAKARSPTINEHYLLQAGSFRDAADADRRRAELLLLGFEPQVEETNGSNGRWFRVLIGPFDSRSRMAAARSLTAQQNIDTLLIRRQP